MNIFDRQDLLLFPLIDSPNPHLRWKMARPLGISLWQRIKAAWVILNNDGCVVRWYH